MAAHDLRLWTRSFSQADSLDGDIIRKVSLITMGEAKGHNCQIDDVTLQQLLECSKRFTNGVRANLGHFTGIENSFGHITNLHIDGDKLIGDLNLFQEHPSFALTKRQIKTIPDTFGFSVYFNGPDEVKMIPDANGKEVPVNFARCTELYSSDLVPEPAANPSGVFEKGQPESITVDNRKKSMADETPDLKKDINDMLSKHADHMAKMNERMDELCAKVEAIGTDDTGVDKDAPEDKEPKDKDESPMSRKELDERDKALRSGVVQDFLKALSDSRTAPPASATVATPSAEKALSEKKDEPKFKTFHEAYRAQRALGKKQSESMNLAAAEFPELHKAYCIGQENGEAWTREPLDKKTYSALQLQGKLR